MFLLSCTLPDALRNLHIFTAAPFVTTSMIEGFIGQPLTFCRIYTYPTDFAVRVFKLETGVEQVINRMERYSRRNITFGIHQAEFSNIGNYTCTATNRFGATTSDPFEAFIYGGTYFLNLRRYICFHLV